MKIDETFRNHDEPRERRDRGQAPRERRRVADVVKKGQQWL
jgi:hypothetical protein